MKYPSIILATNNEGKRKELLMILGDAFSIITLDELGDDSIVNETGKTFSENSLIKAEYYFKKYNKPVISDDSGLEVIALSNKPGVHSKRYSGGDDTMNNMKLLSEMKDKTKREARFVSVVTLYLAKDQIYQFSGELVGEIAKEMKGTNGFGYDPIFYLKEYNKNLAELEDSIKNQISHRYKALLKMKEKIDELFDCK